MMLETQLTVLSRSPDMVWVSTLKKPVFGDLRTTKAQTSLSILISDFVVHFLESIIFKLATGEISNF